MGHLPCPAQVRWDLWKSQPQPAPLEAPGKAEGDVGRAVLQLPAHLLAAGGTDAPERAGAALDARRHDVLVAVQRDELHSHLQCGDKGVRAWSHTATPPGPMAARPCPSGALGVPHRLPLEVLGEVLVVAGREGLDGLLLRAHGEERLRHGEGGSRQYGGRG